MRTQRPVVGAVRRAQGTDVIPLGQRVLSGSGGDDEVVVTELVGLPVHGLQLNLAGLQVDSGGVFGRSLNAPSST